MKKLLLKNIKLSFAIVFVAILVSGGVGLFSTKADALIQAVTTEQYDGGGGGYSGGSSGGSTSSSYPPIPATETISSCSNGLIVTREYSCSGTTLVVTINRTSWTDHNYCIQPGYTYDPYSGEQIETGVCAQYGDHTYPASSVVEKTVANYAACAPKTPCTSSPNACGETTSGYITNGVCDATTPSVNLIKYPKYGQSCSLTVCGQTNYGKLDCSGFLCSATLPPLPANEGQICYSEPNNLGQKNSGTYKCNVCSATKPADDTTCGNTAKPANYGQPCTSAANACGKTTSDVIGCDGLCHAKTPDNPGPCTSSPNICGVTTSSTYNCDGTCPAVTPANPGTCTSAANICGMTSTMTRRCDGTCPATKPSDALCPVACTSAPNACGQTTSGMTVNGVCNAVTPQVSCPTYGQVCYSAPNSIGERDQKTINCNCVCPAVTPPEPPSCSSAPNDCKQVSSGKVINGVCNAVTPANPANYNKPCTSAPNSVGQTSTGVTDCNGVCQAVTPPEPGNCNSAPNACNQVSSGKIINGVCNAVTPANPANYNKPCTSSPNNVGQTSSDFTDCNGVCKAIKPADAQSCTSSANACGQTSSGYIINGTCNAKTPANPQIYIDTGSCVPPPVINGACGSSADSCNVGYLQDRADTGTDVLWTCKGSNNGTDAQCSTPIQIVPAPTVTVTPATRSINFGAKSTFNWSATNATECTRYENGAFREFVSPNSGSYTSDSLVTNTSFQIQCVNRTGSGPSYPTTSGTHSVTVSPIPTPVVNVTPATSAINAGDQSSFSWNVTNATNCNLYVNGTLDRLGLPMSQTYTTPILNSSTNYEVRCVNIISGYSSADVSGYHDVSVAIAQKAQAQAPAILTVVSRPNPAANKDIAFGDNSVQQLVLRNDGEAPLTGTLTFQANTNGSFSITPLPMSFGPLAFGETAIFYVKYSPTRKGNYLETRDNATLFIDSNANDVTELMWGNGVEKVSGPAGPLNVGDVPIGVPRIFTYSVTNNTNDPVDACIRMGGASKFSCVSPDDCSINTASHQSSIFKIKFAPDVLGPDSDTMNIGAKDVNGNCVTVYSIGVNGRGVPVVDTIKER